RAPAPDGALFLGREPQLGEEQIQSAPAGARRDLYLPRRLLLAGYSWPQVRIMEGQPYGVIWGYGWKRNCVAKDPCFSGVPRNTLLIGNDGFPIRSDELRNLGTVMPNWIGSVSSEIRFKNL